MADWRSMRASGADRERAADLLRAAHGDGRLAWQDYSSRLERLMSSTTHGEIEQVVGDLIPGNDRGGADAGAPAPGGHPPAAPGPSAGAAGAGPTIRTTGPPTMAGNRHQTNRRKAVHGSSRPGAAGNTQRTGADRLASAAVVCGSLVPFTVGISGIPAIVLGHLARRRLKQLPEQAVGNSGQMATAALVLGYLPVVVVTLLVLFLLSR